MSALRLHQSMQLSSITADPLAGLTEEKRKEARRLEALLLPAVEKVQQHGLSARKAALWLSKTRGKEVGLSAASIGRDLGNYLKHGIVALVSGNNGKPRKDYGWELRAQQLYNRPSKPSRGDVAEWLQDEGFESATLSRVDHYLKTLPAQLGEHSPARVGRHAHRLNLARYNPRTTEDLPVGLVYQGDGHTVDVYLAHPATGMPYRPELIAWIDVASRYIVGWWLCEDESQVDIVHSLAHAFTNGDNQPAMLHTDNGKFRDRMLADTTAGYYNRFGIELMLAIPGNPRGKGHIERWFRTMESRFGKKWDTYCGKDMAEEENRRITAEVKNGKRHLPSVEDYFEQLGQWITRYNATPHGSLNGRAPIELWSQREVHPMADFTEGVLNPSVRRTVRNYMVRIDGRLYRHPALADHNLRQVIAEFNLRNDAQARITDLEGRWVCDADLVERAPYLSQSRIEDLKRKRAEHQIKRLEKHADEARRRAGMQITADRTLNALESFGAEEVLPQQKEAEGLPPLDLLDTSY